MTSRATLESVAVWVRLPGLPVEYYDLTILKEIAAKIGPVLRINAHTAAERHGRYARVCVQLNLDKPLLRRLRIGKLKQEIQYEGLNLFCQTCGKIKESSSKCPCLVDASAIKSTLNLNNLTSTPSQQDPVVNQSAKEGKIEEEGWTIVLPRKPKNKLSKPPQFSKNHFGKMREAPRSSEVPSTDKGNLKPQTSQRSWRAKNQGDSSSRDSPQKGPSNMDIHKPSGY